MRKKGYKVMDEYRPYDIPNKAFDRSYAKNLEAYLSHRLNSKNSVNMHLRSLQAIINDAEDTYEELTGHRPLDGIKKTSTPNAPVVLSVEDIEKIRSLFFKFEENTSRFHVINFFLFMFNNMGMNFMDLALAKVRQFDGVRFNYTRKKTEEEGILFLSNKIQRI